LYFQRFKAQHVLTENSPKNTHMHSRKFQEKKLHTGMQVSACDASNAKAD